MTKWVRALMSKYKHTKQGWKVCCLILTCLKDGWEEEVEKPYGHEPMRSLSLKSAWILGSGHLVINLF